jgi:uncharacterized protein (DUF362 family)/NAD-dependent dihydropyrimidine dehydrogenase PreA subunit
MHPIVAGHCDSYDIPRLKQIFLHSFGELGFSFGSSRVLLKPNLLTGKAPKKAVNTHPRFVHALAEILLEENCEVFVGDSPGYESTERALSKSGIMEVVQDLKLNVAPFNKRVKKANNGISPYKEFLFAEDPLDYDLVINLPKLKTHVMMGLTAGVKNTFGFIPSLEKAKWHLRCGRNTPLFASVLIDIHRLAKPSLTVLDGIVGMDGDGPSNGRVRPIGLVAVSRDALSLDRFLEKTLSMPFSLPISSVALERGLLEESSLIDLGVPRVDDFRMPGTMRVDWNLPSVLRETARSVFIKKPKCDTRKCTMCRTCIDVCPASALTRDENDEVRFDYRKCIRCYCCQEMCPTGAIHL